MGDQGPTKQEIWEELIETRRETERTNARLTAIIQQNTQALTQSTAAVGELQTTVSALNHRIDENNHATARLVTHVGEKFEQSTGQMTTLIEQMTEVLCDQSGGVPLKTFYAVVGLLLMLLVAIAGVKLSDLGPLLGLGGG